MDEPTAQNRPLAPHERRLVQWMLAHASTDPAPFLKQTELASVTPWRCPCGCASFNLAIEGLPVPSGGMRTLADFVFDDGDDLAGIFIYEQSGILSGVEVYGLAGDAPRTLPQPEALRPAFIRQ